MVTLNQNSRWIALSLSLLLQGMAHAQSGFEPQKSLPGDSCMRDPECARRCELARQHSQASRFTEALVQYQVAYALRAVPTLLFNIARMRHKLGYLGEAARDYERYLEKGGPADEALRSQARQHLWSIALARSAPFSFPTEHALTPPPSPAPPTSIQSRP